MEYNLPNKELITPVNPMNMGPNRPLHTDEKSLSGNEAADCPPAAQESEPKSFDNSLGTLAVERLALGPVTTEDIIDAEGPEDR